MNGKGLDLTLPRRAAGVRVGREALSALRDALGLVGYHDARLLVSELLTNSVVHGDGETMRLRVSETPGGHLFEIIDGGRGFEPPPEPRTGGHGLAVLDRVALDWGLFPGEGTHVWFTLARES